MMQRATSRNPVVVLAASGLIGIDVDGPEGVRLLRELHPEPMPRTITVETGKGWHLWYRQPAGGCGGAKIELGPEGVEVAKDGYLCCPPSVHPSGPRLPVGERARPVGLGADAPAAARPRAVPRPREAAARRGDRVDGPDR